MSNIARDLLLPSDPQILARIVFLYVGQGSSTILLAADGDAFQTLLVDINHDEERGGIDVSRLMQDLLGGAPLNVFLNSHPHNDHLCGLDKLREAVAVNAIWHSGHVPSDEHNEVYALLVDALTEVDDAGGDIEDLGSSRRSRMIGEVECYVIAPAEHVQAYIAGETDQAHDERVHEHCVVLRIGSGNSWALLPGDADRDAWEKHIIEYWTRDGRTVQSAVLAAPHHGSRSFFKHGADDKPYLDALEVIAPDYVVISAPAQDESPHGHPHDDAIDLYAAALDNGEAAIFHTGADRHCFVTDIYRDGRYEVWADDGQLSTAYGMGDGGDGGQKSTPSPTRGGPSMRRGGPRIVREAPPFA